MLWGDMESVIATITIVGKWGYIIQYDTKYLVKQSIPCYSCPNARCMVNEAAETGILN